MAGCQLRRLAQRFRWTLVSDGLGVIPLRGFPKIHTVTRYLKALVRTEDPFYVLGTRHMHDPETEGMAIFISEHLCEHHRSERLKGLTERVICTKVRQPADVNVGVHVGPPGEKQELSTGSIVPVDHRTVWSQLLSFEIFFEISTGRSFHLRLIERNLV
jgi:hypothetical protein